MTQGDRIKKIRKDLKLTLEEFGKKVGVTKQTISRIENNINNLTDQMAKSICREFNVNYDYLMYGNGEMFSNVPQTILDELCKQYKCDNLDRNLIESYLKLNTAERKIIKTFMSQLLQPPIEAQQTTEDLEAEYKKSISPSAKKTNYTASNITDGGKDEKAVG